MKVIRLLADDFFYDVVPLGYVITRKLSFWLRHDLADKFKLSCITNALWLALSLPLHTKAVNLSFELSCRRFDGSFS